MHKLSIDGPAVVLLFRRVPTGKLGGQRQTQWNGTIRRVDSEIGEWGRRGTQTLANTKFIAWAKSRSSSLAKTLFSIVFIHRIKNSTVLSKKYQIKYCPHLNWMIICQCRLADQKSDFQKLGKRQLRRHWQCLSLYAAIFESIGKRHR